MRESILFTVFKRSDKSCSLFKWLRLTLLEAYLGDQLLDLLGSVASYTEDTTEDAFLSASANGFKADLSEFIPATLINKNLEKQILELLQTKYLNHYGVMREASRVVSIDGVPTGNPIQYEVNPERLYMLTELRLSYNTIWVSLNITIDIVVFLCTNNVVAALASGAFIEFIRRFKI